MRLEQLERALGRIGALHELNVSGADRPPLRHRFQMEDRIPVLGAVQNDLNLLLELLRLHQRQDLEHLVERPESAREDHQRLGQIRKPELAHEEVVELEVQPVGDEAVRALLEGQADVQSDRLAAGLVGAAVGGLHDAGAAA